jgi:hypothetical protein
MYFLRAAGILLPFYAVMRVIGMIQHGRRQYRLQLLQVGLGWKLLICDSQEYDADWERADRIVYFSSCSVSAGARKKECIKHAQ